MMTKYTFLGALSL